VALAGRVGTDAAPVIVDRSSVEVVEALMLPDVVFAIGIAGPAGRRTELMLAVLVVASKGVGRSVMLRNVEVGRPLVKL
jgi:hypothetical protein